MSLLDTVLYNTISTERLTASTGITKTYQTNLTNVSCLLMPITPEFAAKTGMVYDRSYTCMVDPGVDIQISDRIIDSTGKSYQVTGSRNMNYGITVQHVTFLLNEESGATPDQ